MNWNGLPESWWWRVLDGVFSSVGAISVAGEVLSLFSHVVAFLLSSLLEVFSGL